MTSAAQVRQRMQEYNLMQVTPGSGARLCSYTVPEQREVVDCEANWDELISLITGSPAAVEAIRAAQVTHVAVKGERATATLSFGGTFEWRWRDGNWLLSTHL